MTTVQDVVVESRPAAGEVLPLLREQAGLYARLETLANRQRSLVTGDEVGPLLMLLADRQKLSESLVQIGHRLAPIRRDWSACRERLEPSQRVEAERLIGEARDRLRRIMQMDEQDARVLAARKETAAKTLQAAHSTSQAAQAYRGPRAAAGRLDCMDEASQ